MDIHITIIMVHRLLEDIPVTSYRMSVQLGVPEECSGVVCSADREAEGALHFNRQKALNMKGKLAYLTETKFQAVRATHLCQMTDAKRGSSGSTTDSIFIKGMEHRFPHGANRRMLEYIYIYIGGPIKH